MPDLVPSTDDIEIESNGTPVANPPALPAAAIEASEDADAAPAVDPGDEDPQPEAKPEPVAAKPRNSLQARIDKSVAAQREAERRADAAERALAQHQTKPADAPAKTEPQYTRAKPSENEIGSKYADYPAYIEDLTDWKLEQRDAQQAERDQRTAITQRHEAHAQKFSERIAKAEQADPDFWSKISPAVADLRPSTAFDPKYIQSAARAANQGDINARAFLGSVTMADIIFDSEYSTELMAHFSANDPEFQRLSTLPPSALHREMGRLEARFVRPEAASTGPAPKTRVVSNAPPPIKPVGTTASTAEVNPLEDELDVDEHIRVMNSRDHKGRFKR